MKDDSNTLRHRAVEPIDTQKVERIKKLMRFYNLSQTQLAERLEINQPNLSAILSGKRPCRKNMDAKFLEAFPEVSKAWLLTGEGDMLRDREVGAKSEVYRDAFMLSFYLIGINAADLLALKKSDVVNGRINYKRAKTGRHYSIKIEPEAQAILDKYPGANRLLSFANIKHFPQQLAYHLDKIMPGLTWYYARYSWANYAIDLDVPKDIVSECLGHSHGAAVTGVYIRYTHDKIDKANRQVLDYFAGKK